MRRFGFDLHGVLRPTYSQLNAVFDPEWFVYGIHSCMRIALEVWRDYLVTFKKHGEVWVISGPPLPEVEEELSSLDYVQGVHYDNVVSVVDFLKSIQVDMWLDEKNTWWASEHEWWSSKAKICEKYGIEAMIDDQERYGRYFKNIKTKFHLWQPEENKLSCAGMLAPSTK